jgi:membrane protein
MGSGPLDLGGLTVADLGKRVWAEMTDDNVWDAAAQLGYYFMLALFPLLIVLLSFVALVPDMDLVNSFMATLRDVMPERAYQLVGTEIERILNTSSGGLLTFGMLGTIWAASSGVVSLIGTLNRAYEAKEKRGFVALRVRAVLLTFALAALLITGAALLTMGDQIVGAIVSALGFDWLGTIVGALVNYALGLGLLFAALEVVYYFGPNIPDQKWHWLSPGSLAGVLLFVVSSVGFTIYLRFNDTYSVTYGSIGAVIILMLWLYLLGLSIVIGAEINSEIARAAAARGNAEAPDDNVDSAEAETRGEAATRTSPGQRAEVEKARKPEAREPEAKQASNDAAPERAPSSGAAPETPRETLRETLRETPPAPRAPLIPSADDGADAQALVVRDLLASLENANARVRAGAAMTLGLLAKVPQHVVEQLEAHADDEDAEVRREVERALARIRDEAA